jgi:hypothetical protein
MTRRIVVAFVEVENAQDRAWRHVANRTSLDEVIAEGKRPRPKSFHDDGRTPDGRLRYWCAADKPDTDQTFQVAPVYRTNGVAKDAQCETCGLSIRELQELMKP